MKQRVGFVLFSDLAVYFFIVPFQRYVLYGAERATNVLFPVMLLVTDITLLAFVLLSMYLQLSLIGFAGRIARQCCYRALRR